MEAKEYIRQPYESFGDRIISTWTNYPSWLAENGVDFGETYTQLERAAQIALVNRFNKAMDDASAKGSAGANYG